MIRRRKTSPKSSEQERVVASPDGVLTFRLMKGKTGVFVERVQRRGAGTLSHSAVFFSQEEFAAFCDTDDLRFNYQLLYLQLRKNFEDLFDGAPNPA